MIRLVLCLFLFTRTLLAFDALFESKFYDDSHNQANADLQFIITLKESKETHVIPAHADLLTQTGKFNFSAELIKSGVFDEADSLLKIELPVMTSKKLVVFKKTILFLYLFNRSGPSLNSDLILLIEPHDLPELIEQALSRGLDPLGEVIANYIEAETNEKIDQNNMNKIMFDKLSAEQVDMLLSFSVQPSSEITWFNRIKQALVHYHHYLLFSDKNSDLSNRLGDKLDPNIYAKIVLDSEIKAANQTQEEKNLIEAQIKQQCDVEAERIAAEIYEDFLRYFRKFMSKQRKNALPPLWSCKVDKKHVISVASKLCDKLPNYTVTIKDYDMIEWNIDTILCDYCSVNNCSIKMFFANCLGWLAQVAVCPIQILTCGFCGTSHCCCWIPRIRDNSCGEPATGAAVAHCVYYTIGCGKYTIEISPKRK